MADHAVTLVVAAFATSDAATTVSEGLSGDQLAVLKQNQGPTAYEQSMIERGAVDTSRFQ